MAELAEARLDAAWLDAAWRAGAELAAAALRSCAVAVWPFLSAHCSGVSPVDGRETLRTLCLDMR